MSESTINVIKAATTPVFGILGISGSNLLDKSGILTKDLEIDSEDTITNEVSKEQPYKGLFYNLANFLWNVLLTIIFFYAIYLAFKCKGGLNIVQIIVAFCFSPFYVLYRIAVPCGGSSSSSSYGSSSQYGGKKQK